MHSIEGLRRALFASKPSDCAGEPATPDKERGKNRQNRLSTLQCIPHPQRGGCVLTRSNRA